MDSFTIIANGHVVMCDPGNRAGRYDLLIRDNRIAEISETPGLFTSLHPNATVVDASHKLIIPGFVNAHFHSESVLLRSRTDGLHFSAWKEDPLALRCIEELLDPLNSNDVRNVYHMSYFSHLKSGTTCVGEFGLPFQEESFGNALQAIERTEVRSVVALQNWDQFVRASDVKGGRHRFVVNLGRAEDFTVYSFENLMRAAKELKVPVLAHVAEHRSELDFVKRSFQKNIIGVLKDYNVVNAENMFVHLNHASSQETEAISEAGASVVLCARSAAFKRTGYPALRYLATQRIRLAVGTDWGSVDMLEELRFLHQLHLLISGIPPFSPLQLLRMGTINGAHALGLSAETGSIEVGKKADLAFYILDDMRLPVIPEYTDAEFLSSLLINYLTSREISDVMIDGEFYVGQGEVMTMAEEEIVQGFRASHAKLLPDQPQRVSVATPQPDTPTPRQSLKILPFSSPGKPSQLPDEGFESGFQVTEKVPGVLDLNPTNINMEPPPDTTAPQRDTPPSKPQPHKSGWLTFGENEDF